MSVGNWVSLRAWQSRVFDHDERGPKRCPSVHPSVCVSICLCRRRLSISEGGVGSAVGAVQVGSCTRGGAGERGVRGGGGGG